jgi:carbon-monoxide dehydrogenase large subunit
MHDIHFGVSPTRVEDGRLVTGAGRYTADLRRPGMLFAIFVRSPHPNARILSIATEAALAHPGVVAVLTGADAISDGVDANRAPARFASPDGDAFETKRPLLCHERVRFVGEPCAMVIAESLTAAMDAAELVAIDYAPEAAIVDVASAQAPGAPQMWAQREGNVAYRWSKGDKAGLQAALASAHHVTRLTSRISRVTAAAMEPRAALAYVGEDGRPVLHASHQSPHLLRAEIAAIFDMPKEALRVIATDVGGSFGMKSGPLREEIAVLWAARRLRRPVRWTATRGESFACDDQARDLEVDAELALAADGRFTALHVRYSANIGAYFSMRSTVAITNFGGIAGVYATPVIVGESTGYFTHQPPTAAYRGAGRPEATYALERLIDAAAAEMNIDPAELRLRNLIAPSAMPYQTPFIFRYDCGEFERNMRQALAKCDYAGFARRREESKKRGKLRGIGLANPIEVAGGPYAALPTEWSRIEANADGSVTLVAGTMSVGQGHETTLSNLVAQTLGLPLASVRYMQGDTDAIADGKGNGGSSGLILGGSAARLGAQDLLGKAKALAEEELEVAAWDLVYENGVFKVPGSDVQITLAQLANISQARGQTLAGAGQFQPASATFPNGCHVCEVEIDPQTGQVQVLRYIGVEDVGRVLDPMLVEGQIHGGVAQGIGQALLEQVHYDADGQLTTGSFMDYAMPRAFTMPTVETENPQTPTALNPLGVKGVGEAGTVGALAATMNAVCHALAPAGIRHLDMPATPVRVWQALHEAGYFQPTAKA